MTSIGGWEYGVADHNLVDLTVVPTNGIWVGTDGYSGHADGNGAWADTTGLGSNRYMYLENNIFNNQNGSGNGFADDCYRGRAGGMRFNTFNSVTVQTHPTTGADTRGCRASETYDNTSTNTNRARQPTMRSFGIAEPG